MKIRNGFVSNSSSSSFLLFKAYLTKEQIEQVRNWEKFAVSDEFKVMLYKYAETHEIEDHYTTNYDGTKGEPFDEMDFPYYPEGWTVQETNDVFEIGTSMDNFNMEQYLAVLGIDIEKNGLRIEDHHCAVLGLNNARSDIKDYVSDPYYFDHYNDDYWFTSEYYRDRIYPIDVRMKAKNPVMPDPVKPKEKKVWICEDAGQALNELESEFNKFAIDNGYINWLDKEGKFLYKEKISSLEVFRKIFNILEKVKDNWKARDDFKEKT